LAAFVVVVGLIGACGGPGDPDLLFDLATVNAVIELNPADIAARGTDEVTQRTGAQETVTDDLFLFQVVGGSGLVALDRVSVTTGSGAVWFYRDPTVQRGFERIIAGSTRLVLLLEQRPAISDGGVSVLGRLIALDASGSVVTSDWAGGPGEAQVERLGEQVAEQELEWTTAVRALSSAARDEELGQEIEDPLGAALLEAVRG
jgi:hypothetical protein